MRELKTRTINFYIILLHSIFEHIALDKKREYLSLLNYFFSVNSQLTLFIRHFFPIFKMIMIFALFLLLKKSLTSTKCRNVTRRWNGENTTQTRLLKTVPKTMVWKNYTLFGLRFYELKKELETNKFRAHLDEWKAAVGLSAYRRIQ